MPFIHSKRSAQPAQTDWKSCNSKIPLQIPLQGKATRQNLAFVFTEIPHLSGLKKNWDSRTIKSSYTIWIGRNLWTSVCSISTVSLFANFPLIPTFPCSISQDLNNILCAFCFSPFTVFFFFSYLLFSSYTKSTLSTQNSPLNNLFNTLTSHLLQTKCPQ